MFFNAYFDDSGTDLSSRVIAVGGCATYVNNWVNLNYAWQECLDKWGLTHFHMTDYEALCGDYRSWGKREARRRLRELLDIIYKCGVVTFGYAMSRKEFEEAVETEPDISDQLGGPYGFLGQMCLRLVRSVWGNFFTSWGNKGDLAYVSYFFEDGTPGYGKIEEAFHRTRETVRWQDALITRILKNNSNYSGTSGPLCAKIRGQAPT